MIYFSFTVTNGLIRDIHTVGVKDMTRTILIIDDDDSLRELVREYLELSGMKAVEASNADEALTSLAKYSPDLILLDIMLPGKTGFDACKEIRRVSDVPIIMLTARGAVQDRVLGLELGADDYLPKPFEPRELIARITAILRRGRAISATTGSVLHFEGLSIDTVQRSVLVRGKTVPMTTAEFELLILFAGRPSETLNRDQISLHLRGTEWEVVSRSVDAVMSRLRQKLEDDPKHPTFFRTIWGTGYMFIARPRDTTK
jgi:DNA-binding response OmpR family regulator